MMATIYKRTNTCFPGYDWVVRWQREEGKPRYAYFLSAGEALRVARSLFPKRRDHAKD